MLNTVKHSPLHRRIDRIIETCNDQLQRNVSNTLYTVLNRLPYIVEAERSYILCLGRNCIVP